jgi:hypothetical protein
MGRLRTTGLKANQAGAGGNQDGRGQAAQAGGAMDGVGEGETLSPPLARLKRPGPYPPKAAASNFLAACRP